MGEEQDKHTLIWPELIQKIRLRTPARILVDRSGPAYRTPTQLELRRAHAAARDAVRAELDLSRDLGEQFICEWKLFEVCTIALARCLIGSSVCAPDAWLARLWVAH